MLGPAGPGRKRRTLSHESPALSLLSTSTSHSRRPLHPLNRTKNLPNLKRSSPSRNVRSASPRFLSRCGQVAYTITIRSASNAGSVKVWARGLVDQRRNARYRRLRTRMMAARCCLGSRRAPPTALVAFGVGLTGIEGTDGRSTGGGTSRNGIWACECRCRLRYPCSRGRGGGGRENRIPSASRNTMYETDTDDNCRVEEVVSGIEPGPHTLHCELLEHTLDPQGRTEFRIFAVMHD